MNTSEQILIPIVLPPVADPLRRAVAAYLARFTGQSRVHTDSDLRSFLSWCQDRGLPASRATPPCRAVRALDAGSPPVQALDR